SPRSHRKRPAFPARLVLTVSFVLSPVIGLSCHRRRLRCASTVANLTSASSCQDHPTSPSALAPFVIGANASIASRIQRSWRSRNAPLSRARDARTDARDLPDGASNAPAAHWHDGQIRGACCNRV